tara:strand:- start:671 stop:928 length:258 start_codon:yes stop_codon:yes gene_type:complete
MATKSIRNVKLTDSLTISECKDGYWLYDYTRGMNLSMRAKTETDAFVEAITYYQKMAKRTGEELKKLHKAVDVFIESVSDEDDDN